MQCNKCKYTARSDFNYCPMCGNNQVDIRFLSPDYAVLGKAFQVVVNMNGILRPELTHIEYSGQQIKKRNQVLSDGEIIVITINQKPIFNNNQLTLHITGYPTQSMKLELIDPTELSFTVQGMYEIKPFINESKVHLSFSLYDKFVLKASSGGSFWGKCKLELVVPDLFNPIVAKHSNEGYILPSDSLESLFDKEEISACLKLMMVDTILVESPIVLSFNKIPDFQIGNVQEIVQRLFNVDRPDRPFSNLKLKVLIDRTKSVSDKTEGSDLRSFRISSNKNCLAVDGRNRYEKPEDLNAGIEYLAGKLNSTDLDAIANKGQFDFGIDIEIKTNKTLPMLFCKHFKFAMPVQSNTQRSSFAVIDFGTTNSCIVDEDGKLIPTESGSFEHKTRIDFVKFDNANLNDQYAFPQSDALPTINTAINFKSMLIDHYAQTYIYKDIHGSCKGFKPPELTRIYLKYLSDRLESVTNMNPLEIVTTYPAVFSKKTKQEYLQLQRDIGYSVNEQSCITEPEAIAFYYLNQNEKIRKMALDKGKVTIAVFDCGGGTTDYAIVEYALDQIDHKTKVLASWGTEKFGGVYLSYALAKCDFTDSEKITDDFSSIYNETDKSKYFIGRYAYYEQAKISLSNKLLSDSSKRCEEVFSSFIEKNNINKWVSVYQDVFIGSADVNTNKDIRSIRYQLSQIGSVIEELFKNDMINTPYADFVILAGNSCRLPLFKHFADLEFEPEHVIMELDTVKTSVALGAHIYRSRGSDMIFEGLSRSNLVYYRYSPLGDKIPVFKRWLDMTQENQFPLKDDNRIVIKGHRTNVFTFFRSDLDGNESRAFEVKPPEDHSFAEASLELMYHEFKISSRWKITSDKREESYTEWQEEFNHE